MRVNAGIGVHKSPELYGAFPTDAYSHTPGGKGAQQPGMTGQVKEDVLSRFGELGVKVRNGAVEFNPEILRTDEFLTTKDVFNYINLAKEKCRVDLRGRVTRFYLLSSACNLSESDLRRLLKYF